MGVRMRTTFAQRVTELAARRLVFDLRQQAAARAASSNDADVNAAAPAACAGQPAAALKDRPASEAEVVPPIYPEDGSPAFEGYSILKRTAALSAAKVAALRNDLAPPEAFRRAVECNPYVRMLASPDRQCIATTYRLPAAMCVRLSEAVDPETGQTWVVPSDTLLKGTKGAFGRFVANRKSAFCQLLQRPDVMPDAFRRPDYARYMYNVHLLRLRKEFETFLAGVSKRDVTRVVPASPADDEEPVGETESLPATESSATGQCGQHLGAAARRYLATRSFNELDSIVCVLTWGFASTAGKVVEGDYASRPDYSCAENESPEEVEESRTDAGDDGSVAEDEQDDRGDEDENELPPFMRIPTDPLEVGVLSAVSAAAGSGGPVRVRVAPCYAVDGLLEAEAAAALRKSFSDLASAAPEDGADGPPVAIAVMSSPDSVGLAKALWRIRLYLQVDEPPEVSVKN